jgi:hypothetical protein
MPQAHWHTKHLWTFLLSTYKNPDNSSLQNSQFIALLTNLPLEGLSYLSGQCPTHLCEHFDYTLSICVLSYTLRKPSPPSIKWSSGFDARCLPGAYISTFFKSWGICPRVARPVTQHLVSQRSANFWRVLLWISCLESNCSPTICAPTESWIVEKDEEMSQMWPSKVGGRFKWWKRKTTAHLEDYYRTPKTSLWNSLYCLYGSKMICRS